jgi:hypothetical protein
MPYSLDTQFRPGVFEEIGCFVVAIWAFFGIGWLLLNGKKKLALLALAISGVLFFLYSCAWYFEPM